MDCYENRVCVYNICTYKVKNKSAEKCKCSCKWGENRISLIYLNMHEAPWSDKNLRTVVTCYGGSLHWEMVDKKRDLTL